MNVINLLHSLEFGPSKEEHTYLKKVTKKFVYLLKKEIRKHRIKADVFVGGSFVKGTIVNSNEYDIDVFVRFDKRYDDEELANILEKIVRKTEDEVGKFKRVHGSRDYFRIVVKRKRIINNNLIFDVIPVLKIMNPREAKNVTDLSYFHVNYVKKNLKKKDLKKEVLLAKVFCKANGIYGAESYINGFSGYALECLIIYYGSFLKLLRAISSAKYKLIIDPERKFESKYEIQLELNESKLKSPIVLIDPTWKERNILASLNDASFLKFKDIASGFLKNPSKRYFEAREFNVDKLIKKARERKAEFLHLRAETNRQEGDIAGTKLKKFYYIITDDLSRLYNIVEHEFIYSGRKYADYYLILKSKGEILKHGPPIEMKKNAIAFRKKNKNVYEKAGMLFARMKVNFAAKDFVRDYWKKNKDRLREMGITKLRFI